MKYFKKIFEYFFLCVLVIVLGLLINSVINFFRVGFFDFADSKHQKIVKASVINEKAAVFNGENILKNLDRNNINGFYYRFDDFIDEASLISPPSTDALKAIDKGYNFEFNDPDKVKLKPRGKKYSIEKGIIKYKFGLSKSKYEHLNILENDDDLNLVRNKIGNFEIRIKVKNTTTLDLGFSSNPEADIYKHTQTEYISVSTIPDNKFHIYTIDALRFEKSWLGEDESIRKFCLWPSAFKENFKEDEIEIDYIRFLSKKFEYSKSFCGVAYVTKANEMRKAIFTHSGHALLYRLNVPESDMFLKLGMGILENSPANFSIKLFTNDKEILLNKTITDNGRWHDIEIPLKGFMPEQAIKIEFSVKSDPPTVAFWSNPVLYTRPKHKFNTVIVLEDALRPDHMSCYGYNKKTTPVKENFVKDGIIFSRAFSQATYTRASCVSLMTSLYPSATGVWTKFDKLHDNYLTLAEIMRSQGFVTLMLTQNINAGPHSGLHQGFSFIFDTDTIGFKPSGIYTNDLLKNFLNSNKNRNLFIYMHILDPHCPYEPPFTQELYEKVNNELQGIHSVKEDPDGYIYDPEWVEKPTQESRIFLYDEEIRNNDFHFSDLLSVFQQFNLYNNTLIAFIADHGEFLGDRGMWGHKPPGFRQVLQVPFILTYPGKIPGNIWIDNPVQLMDIMPTILDYAEIRKDDFLLEGDSLVPLIENKNKAFWNNRICYSDEVLWRTKKRIYGSLFYKDLHMVTSGLLVQYNLFSYLIRPESSFSRSLLNTLFFNMDEDRQEIQPLFSYEIDLLLQYNISRFMKKLRHLHLDINRKISKNRSTPAKLDDSAIKQLRSLGYLQ